MGDQLAHRHDDVGLSQALAVDERDVRVIVLRDHLCFIALNVKFCDLVFAPRRHIVRRLVHDGHDLSRSILVS